MPRRVNLPAADDLFRPTIAGDGDADRAESGRTTKKGTVHAVPDAPDTEDTEDTGGNAVRRPSGRIRHDEKMTVYVTSQELMEIEQTRLRLRGEHGLVVDRGRLVREALSLVLADFDAQGEDSALVRRLSE